MATGETRNKAIVEALYQALARGDKGAVARLVASDLEWCFHGPPRRHHMMRMLTGESGHDEFLFEPRSVEAFGECVIVEGWEGALAYWVHVWTFEGGPVITQLREYFNTWLTVKELRPAALLEENRSDTLWQSRPRDLACRSLPEVVLAI